MEKFTSLAGLMGMYINPVKRVKDASKCDNFDGDKQGLQEMDEEIAKDFAAIQLEHRIDFKKPPQNISSLKRTLPHSLVEEEKDSGRVGKNSSSF